MRAVKFTRYGDPDVLAVVEVGRPAAGPGQVVVAVVTAATNPGEIGIREGRFADIWPAHFPEGQGNDFAGYVAEIGPGVDAFAAGDEVLGFARAWRRPNTSRSTSIGSLPNPRGFHGRRPRRSPVRGQLRGRPSPRSTRSVVKPSWCPPLPEALGSTPHNWPGCAAPMSSAHAVQPT